MSSVVGEKRERESCDACVDEEPFRNPKSAMDRLCSCCNECYAHCLFGGDVCDKCGGHKEGLEVPGEKYCEECACSNCGALFTATNCYVEEGECSACADTHLEEEDKEQ